MLQAATRLFGLIVIGLLLNVCLAAPSEAKIISFDFLSGSGYGTWAGGVCSPYVPPCVDDFQWYEEQGFHFAPMGGGASVRVEFRQP